jgi:hypothetical protein
MGFRSVFVILSLLALVAAPAEANRAKPKPADQAKKKKKNATSKAKDKQAKVTPDKPGASGNGAALIASRSPAGAKKDTGNKDAAKKTGAVVASTTAKARSQRVRPQPRMRNRPVGGDQVMGAGQVTNTATAAFDTRAAVTPNRRRGRVRRMIASVLVAGTLVLGAVGWQSAGMTERVGDWFNTAQAGIEQVFNGGGEAEQPGGNGGSSQPGGGLPGGGGEQPPESDMDPTPDTDNSPTPDPDQPPQAPENPKPGGAGKPGTGGQPPETDNAGN